MDFRQHTASLDSLASVACDALLVVLAGEKAERTLDATLAKLLADAVSHGDFEFKRGKSVLLHRPAGVKAARVLSWPAALPPQVGEGGLRGRHRQIKGGGSKHVAVAIGGAGEVGAEAAESLVAAVGDATYVYRHTK